MTSQIFVEKLLEAAGCDPQTTETTIGVFQSFRPDGLPDSLPWQSTTGGDIFQNRVQRVFEAVRTSRRADALQDAYFVVRNPPMLTSEQAHALAQQLLAQLAMTCRLMGSETGIRLLEKQPSIRVLEGVAPKHPRKLEEKSQLLLLFQRDLPAAIDALFCQDSLGAQLSEALYFVACDSLLRDYLRWPLLSQESVSQESLAQLAEQDPLVDYFELWRHGVKYRIFSDQQIDIYLPRRASGTLLDAGQFAMDKQRDI
ncbi:MAG: hypothetical protein NXI32_13715 [bacterium]|nr:hypothetical protein [bacterium]